MQKILLILLSLFSSITPIESKGSANEIQSIETPVSDSFASVTTHYIDTTLTILYFVVFPENQSINFLELNVEVEYINTNNEEVEVLYNQEYVNTRNFDNSTIYTFNPIVLTDVIEINKISIELIVNNNTYQIDTMKTGNVEEVYVVAPSKTKQIVLKTIFIFISIFISLGLMLFMWKILKKRKNKKKNKKLKNQMSLFWY